MLSVPSLPNSKGYLGKGPQDRSKCRKRLLDQYVHILWALMLVFTSVYSLAPKYKIDRKIILSYHIHSAFLINAWKKLVKTSVKLKVFREKQDLHLRAIFVDQRLSPASTIRTPIFWEYPHCHPYDQISRLGVTMAKKDRNRLLTY